MRLPPAEYCCGACPLLHGVQIIASYTVVVGTFHLLALLMRGPADKPVQSDTIQVVDFLETVFQALAFFAGLKGLIGVMFRDPRRLRMLLLYHVGELVVRSIAFVFQMVEACDELTRLQRARKLPNGAPNDDGSPAKHERPLDCGTLRILFALQFVGHGALFSYFVYVIWSLVTRLESGELGLRRGLDLEQELALADAGGLADSWLFMGGGHDQNAVLLQQNRDPLSAGRAGGEGRRGAADGGGGGRGPAATGPRPFSGAPRTLADGREEEETNTLFRGTPHRLE